MNEFELALLKIMLAILNELRDQNRGLDYGDHRKLGDFLKEGKG